MDFFLTHQNSFTQLFNNNEFYGQALELIIGNNHTSLYLCHPNNDQSISIH